MACPIDVDIIVCPSFKIQTSMIYRDLDGTEQKVRTTKDSEEIAHLVLTINNNKSYCVPYIIDQSYGEFIRCKKPHNATYKEPTLDIIQIIKTRKTTEDKEPWYKKLCHCFKADLQ
jgi:hypothetical protein